MKRLPQTTFLNHSKQNRDSYLIAETTLYKFQTLHKQEGGVSDHLTVVHNNIKLADSDWKRLKAHKKGLVVADVPCERSKALSLQVLHFMHKYSIARYVSMLESHVQYE